MAPKPPARAQLPTIDLRAFENLDPANREAARKGVEQMAVSLRNAIEECTVNLAAVEQVRQTIGGTRPAPRGHRGVPASHRPRPDLSQAARVAVEGQGLWFQSTDETGGNPTVVDTRENLREKIVAKVQHEFMGSKLR